MHPVIRVIIVDDHEIFRCGLKMIISKLGYVKIVAEAENGLDFLRLLEHEETDLVLMDIEMPLMNGIEATKKAMELYPGLKIIALSMYKEDTYIQSMLAAGVKGFLLKNIRKEVLDRALQAVFAGRTYYSEELWDYFTKSKALEESTDQGLNITRRESEVLHLLAEGLNNKAIADRLFVSERTIVGHKSNLMAKTNCKNTVALLAFAIKNGLISM